MTKYAEDLWARIRYECNTKPSPSAKKKKTNLNHPSMEKKKVPELRIYPLFHRPVGPHPVGMFEVNLFTPAQFGAFIPWLVVNRGPLSALVHPNTEPGDWESPAVTEKADHTTGAIWLGERFPLDVGLFDAL